MSTIHPTAGTNLAVLVGTLTRAPEPRSLPSGDEVLSLELTIRSDGLPTDSVPVAWFNPNGSAGSIEVGDELLVVGRVRRRFFQAGGTTQSRTEVVASRVVPTRKAAAATKALAAALATIDP
ncbi:MAG: single-stranded DNA-binding protein [Actinomycetota bacterium]|nr:single-stranded DNA-binding protein [Actinomycetota bacterium]